MKPQAGATINDLQEVLGKILLQMEQQRAEAQQRAAQTAAATATRKENADQRKAENENKKEQAAAPSFWRGAKKAGVTAGNALSPDLMRTIGVVKNLVAGLTEIGQSFFNAPPKDWSKGSRSSTTSGKAPSIPQAHKTPAPAGWASPGGQTTAPTFPAPSSSPAQRWSWGAPATPGTAAATAPGALPPAFPSSANSATNAPTAAPPASWSGRSATSTGFPKPAPQNATPPASWSAAPVSPSAGATPGSGPDGAASPVLLRIAGALDKQTALLERMALRLDEIGNDEDDKDGNEGLEHEHTRPTSAPKATALTEPKEDKGDTKVKPIKFMADEQNSKVSTTWESIKKIIPLVKGLS